MVSEQEGLERYLKVLNEQLDRKRGTEDFKQLQELFESAEFLEMLRTQRLDTLLEAARKKKANNRAVVNYLIEALKKCLQGEDAGNENMEYLYFYFKRQITRKDNCVLLLLMTGVVIASIIGCACSQWYRVDSILLKKAPARQEVCEELEWQYGIETSPEEIEVSCGFNTDRYTNKKYPKMVIYTMPVTIRNMEVSLTATWVPGREIYSDYATQYMRQCLIANSITVSEYENDPEPSYGLDAGIHNEKDKEQFEQQFIKAVREAYEDEKVQKGDFTFRINLGVNDLDEIVYVHIYHDDPEEDLEEFSADLEEAFGKAIAFQSLFE